mmetsp:Transcript_6815/g.15637  ORF Transcript_6815/g.15637 Transcript_6815/m.15637 type:complete len:375 (-) Transcript_6815:78-1202(-)
MADPVLHSSFALDHRLRDLPRQARPDDATQDHTRHAAGERGSGPDPHLQVRPRRGGGVHRDRRGRVPRGLRVLVPPRAGGGAQAGQGGAPPVHDAPQAAAAGRGRRPAPGPRAQRRLPRHHTHHAGIGRDRYIGGGPRHHDPALAARRRRALRSLQLRLGPRARRARKGGPQGQAQGHARSAQARGGLGGTSGGGEPGAALGRRGRGGRPGDGQPAVGVGRTCRGGARGGPAGVPSAPRSLQPAARGGGGGAGPVHPRGSPPAHKRPRLRRGGRDAGGRLFLHPRCLQPRGHGWHARLAARPGETRGGGRLRPQRSLGQFLRVQSHPPRRRRPLLLQVWAPRAPEPRPGCPSAPRSCSVVPSGLLRCRYELGNS